MPRPPAHLQTRQATDLQVVSRSILCVFGFWSLVFGFWFLVFDLTEGSLSGRITQSGVSERAGPSYAPDSGWQFVVGFTQNKALKTSLVERNELVVTCSPLFRSFSGFYPRQPG